MPTVLATRFPGIYVRLGDTDSTQFLQLVEEALATINSSSCGAELLRHIATAGPTSPSGYKIVIMSSAHTARRTNRTVAQNEANARRTAEGPSSGSTSAIEWDPNFVATPHGNRPAFIGLAHELIHALRNLLGITQPERDADEGETVGLIAVSGLDAGPVITENNIRMAHGVTLRVRYDLEEHTVLHEWAHLTDLF